jgi:hypothetical protein
MGAGFGPWGALAGAILGLGKGMLDKKKEDADRKIQAETTRYSPWTHMQAAAPQRADLLGSTMQGGMTGAAMGQNMNSQNQQNALLDAQKNYWERMMASQPTAGTGQAAGPSLAEYRMGQSAMSPNGWRSGY